MSWNNAPALQKLTASQLGGGRGAQIWGVDVRGQLFTTYQKTPGGEWTKWMKANEWLPNINHPKYVYELAACQLTNDRCRLFVLDHKREIWGIQQDDSGNFTHWWHPSKGYWNNAPAAFKKIAATHGSKSQGSLAETSGGAMFIGLKEDGRFAVCFNTGGDSWSRFRNDWHGVGPAIVEVTACMQGDGRIAIWAIDDNRQLWGAGEKTAGSYDFGPWLGPNWLNAPKLRNIAAVQTSQGAAIIAQDEYFAVRTNFQSAPGSNSWSGWSAQQWAQAPYSFELTASGQNNGLAQIWAITVKQNVTSIAQREVNNWPTRWSDYDPE